MANTQRTIKNWTRIVCRRVRMYALVASAAAIAIAGCGGSSTGARLSEASEITSTLTTILTSLAHGDGTAACRLMTPSARRIVVRSPATNGAATCVAAVDSLPPQLTGATAHELENARVVDVHVVGTSATARVAGATGHAQFAQTGGRWLLSGGLVSFPH